MPSPEHCRPLVDIAIHQRSQGIMPPGAAMRALIERCARRAQALGAPKHKYKDDNQPPCPPGDKRALMKKPPAIS